MRVVVLSGGVAGARFLRGLQHATAGQRIDLTVICNTGDDITLLGLRVCPDLDTVMYTLGGGIHEVQGWGRADETFGVQQELSTYDAAPTWFSLGDRDLATHLYRTERLRAGHRLSQVTENLCARWGLPDLGVTLLPMTDDRVETHIVIDDDYAPVGRRLVRLQEYRVRLRAQPAAHGVVAIGAESATPAPGVLEAIAAADVVLLPPSNPVVTIGAILGVPGLRDALGVAKAPVVGLSPLLAGTPVHCMLDKVLAAIGVECTASAVARHLGSRRASGLLDGWLVHPSDAPAVSEVEAAGITCRAAPLPMADVAAAANMARSALDLAAQIGPMAHASSSRETKPAPASTLKAAKVT